MGIYYGTHEVSTEMVRLGDILGYPKPTDEELRLYEKMWCELLRVDKPISPTLKLLRESHD